MVVGILLACLAGTAVLLLVVRIFWGTVLNSPETVEVDVHAPTRVALHEPFSVSLQMTNFYTTSQQLHSIDLDSNYLENIRLTETEPAYLQKRSLPLTRYASFEFDQELPPGATTVVDLHFVGEKVGQVSGLIDICLADGTLCLALPLAIEIVE